MNKVNKIISTFKDINWKSVGIKALKTFIQAFVASVCISDFLFVTDIETLRTMAVSTAIAGASAGISAVWNAGIEYFDVTVLDIDSEDDEEEYDLDDEESEELG